MTAPKIPVLLTTDCGTEMDDQWAIAHLAVSPRIDLRAVVTTHAPNVPAPAAEHAARSVESVLDYLLLPERPPVVPGSSEPLRDRDTRRPNPGVSLILGLSRDFSPENRLRVLAIGAATDIATALLIDPALADRIEIVAMGFDAWPGGNDVWNVKNDIAAWQRLMMSPVPITVGDSAICLRRLTLTAVEARDALHGSGTAGSALISILSEWLLAHSDLARQVTGNPSAWPVWDEIVVAHLLGMTESAVHPRPRLRDDMTFDHAGDGSGQTIRWITDCDATALWADLTAGLARFGV